MARFALTVACLVAALTAVAAEMPQGDRGQFDGAANLEKEWQFPSPAGVKALGLMLIIELNQGSATLTVENPGGEEVVHSTWEGQSDALLRALEVPPGSGTWTVRLVAEKAEGSWQLSISPVPPQATYILLLMGGCGMISIGAGAIIGWWILRKPALRWFAAGALIWVIGVGIKVIDAFVVMKPFLAWLESTVPHAMYVALGSAWVGIDSSLCEIGVTLLAALLIREMSRDSSRAVAVGAGAGGLEAILLGLAVVAGAVAAVAGVSVTQVAVGQQLTNTPLVYLTGSYERILAICLHIGSRCLILYAVASRRWWPALAGFLLFALVDGIAGLAHLSGAVSWINMWYLEAALTPIAVVCLLATRWCLARWPAPPIVPAQAEVVLMEEPHKDL